MSRGLTDVADPLRAGLGLENCLLVAIDIHASVSHPEYPGGYGG